MTGKHGGPLVPLGAGLLGAGLATRLLISQSSNAVVVSLATTLLLMGAGCVLLDRALKGGAAPGWPALLLPLLLLPGLFPLEARGLAAGLDLSAAILGGLALWGLVQGEGLGKSLFKALMALGLFLSLMALAQTLYQRGELASLHQDLLQAGVKQVGPEAPPLPTGVLAEAFARSRRAAGTFLNANSFAGFLLLLLPLACFMGTRRRIWWPLMALLLAGFLAAGSAGALLALLLASWWGLGARPGPEKGARRLLWLMGCLGLLGLGLLILALSGVWTPAGLAGKVASFTQRLDYHRAAWRLLPRMGFTGLGLLAFGPAALSVLRPGEAWSFFLHDGYLQLLLELGPLCLLALYPLVSLFRRLSRETPAAAGPPPARRVSQLFLLGVVAGTALSCWFSPLLTLAPLASPLADATLLTLVVTVGLVSFFLWRVRPPDLAGPGWRRALLVASGAFVLHGLMDFDLYAPAAATAWGALLALAPAAAGRQRAHPRLWLGLLAAGALLLPLVASQQALQADRVGQALRSSGSARQATLLQALHSPAPDLRALDPALQILVRTARAEEAEALLHGLAPSLRSRPAARRAEARYLLTRTALGEAFREEALRRLQGLRHPGDALDPDFLLTRYRLLKGKDPKAARIAAEAALRAAKRWGLEVDKTPALLELKQAAGH